MSINLQGTILSAGSVDNRFATCAAEESRPSTSSGESSERSETSNPVIPEKERNHVSTHLSKHIAISKGVSTVHARDK
jgi:hypothetical protein